MKPRSSASRRGIYLLPNLFTTLALFAGFYAIIAAVDENFVAAGIAIFVAMILDGMDGRVARLTSTESDFGKEYDSLSDMVAFGLAPAVVVYQWGVARLTEYSMTWGRVGWLVAFLYAVTAALRLARFNSAPTGNAERRFVGLPSPSAAGVVAGFIWVSAAHNVAGLGGLALAFIICATAGALMVSNFRYHSFKEINLGNRIPFRYLLIIPVVLALVALEPPVVLFAMFSLYALSGPVVWLLGRGKRKEKNVAAKVSDSEDA